MANPKPKIELLASRDAADPAKQEPQKGRTWLPVSEVSRTLEVPDRRLRRYLDRHAEFVRSRRTGRKHLIASDAIPTLIRIRDLYDEGATARDIDTALADTRLPLAPAKPGDRNDASTALTSAMLTAVTAKQMTNLNQQVTTLRARVAELDASLEQRDRVLRRALMAMVDLLQYNENERQLAEAERDRDSAHHRQRVLLSLQELLMHQRRRRRWF